MASFLDIRNVNDQRFERWVIVQGDKISHVKQILVGRRSLKGPSNKHYAKSLEAWKIVGVAT